MRDGHARASHCMTPVARPPGRTHASHNRRFTGGQPCVNSNYFDRMGKDFSRAGHNQSTHGRLGRAARSPPHDCLVSRTAPRVGNECRKDRASLRSAVTFSERASNWRTALSSRIRKPRASAAGTSGAEPRIHRAPRTIRILVFAPPPNPHCRGAGCGASHFGRRAARKNSRSVKAGPTKEKSGIPSYFTVFSSALRVHLQLEVLEPHLHRPAGVDLQGEDARQFALRVVEVRRRACR